MRRLNAVPTTGTSNVDCRTASTAMIGLPQKRTFGPTAGYSRLQPEGRRYALARRLDWLKREQVDTAAATHVPESASWYNLETADVLKQLTTPEAGLSVDEARRGMEIRGPNELQAFERSSAWHTLAAQFKNVLVVILLAATVLSGLLGHDLEAAVIAVIVLFVVLLGFIQEYRAERALEALREMAASVGHAIRGGIEGSCSWNCSRTMSKRWCGVVWRTTSTTWARCGRTC